MNAKELAELITGREYPFWLRDAEKSEANLAGLVVVYGHSDDLMEFAGAITDELSCWSGGTAYLSNKGLLISECECDDCPYFERLKEKASKIHGIWDSDPKYGWVYETEIPHETFDVMEDDEFYCKGIVFSLKDVKPIAGAL